MTVEEATQLSQLKARKESLLSHQVLTWKLKSRVDCINEGDANTIFFHSYASTKRNSKSIWALQNQYGELIEDETKLKVLGAQHFSDMFTSDDSSNIEDQLKVIRIFPSFVRRKKNSVFW